MLGPMYPNLTKLLREAEAGETVRRPSALFQPQAGRPSAIGTGEVRCCEDSEPLSQPSLCVENNPNHPGSCQVTDTINAP